MLCFSNNMSVTEIFEATEQCFWMPSLCCLALATVIFDLLETDCLLGGLVVGDVS